MKWIGTITTGWAKPFRYITKTERQMYSGNGIRGKAIGKPRVSIRVDYRNKLRGRKIRKKKWW